MIQRWTTTHLILRCGHCWLSCCMLELGWLALVESLCFQLSPWHLDLPVFLFASVTGAGADNRKWNLRWPKGASFKWCQAGMCHQHYHLTNNLTCSGHSHVPRGLQREKSHHWLAPACQALYKVCVVNSGSGSRWYELTAVPVEGLWNVTLLLRYPNCVQKKNIE